MVFNAVFVCGCGCFFLSPEGTSTIKDAFDEAAAAKSHDFFFQPGNVWGYQSTRKILVLNGSDCISINILYTSIIYL